MKNKVDILRSRLGQVRNGYAASAGIRDVRGLVPRILFAGALAVSEEPVSPDPSTGMREVCGRRCSRLWRMACRQHRRRCCWCGWRRFSGCSVSAWIVGVNDPNPRGSDVIREASRGRMRPWPSGHLGVLGKLAVGDDLPDTGVTLILFGRFWGVGHGGEGSAAEEEGQDRTIDPDAAEGDRSSAVSSSAQCDRGTEK
jgi:hypothetical protein